MGDGPHRDKRLRHTQGIHTRLLFQDALTTVHRIDKEPTVCLESSTVALHIDTEYTLCTTV